MRVRAAAVIIAGLVLTGCASTAQTSAGGPGSGSGTAPAGGGSTSSGPGMGGTASVSPPSSAVAKAAAASCPTSQQETGINIPNAVPVPTGIKVAWVLRCTILSPAGTSTTLVAERSTSNPQALVKALQTPSAQRAKIVCPMLMVRVPYFALVQSDGQLLVPKIPLNNCGLPQSTVVSALNALTFTEISSRPLK